jgi:predicted DNA-binding transcriptional regulator YafY
MKNFYKRRREGFPRMSGGKGEDAGATGFSRPPLARMLRLHEWLMGDRYPNCRKLAEEFEVSAKTVQRDVNFMRDRMGLPIEYVKGRFGFRYTRPVSGFPVMGTAAGRGGGNPWRHSAPPAIGENPALAAAGRGGFAVRIRFDAESARTVRGRTWHATQVIHALPGGVAEITLRARDEWEIARWVLSWGGHAWVIEPPRLRHRVREIAREILARH